MQKDSLWWDGLGDTALCTLHDAWEKHRAPVPQKLLEIHSEVTSNCIELKRLLKFIDVSVLLFDKTRNLSVLQGSSNNHVFSDGEKKSDFKREMLKGVS